MTRLSAWLITSAGQRTIRSAFWAFALLLFTLTHWPALEVPNPVPRTDILMHMSFFGTWTLLCAASGWFAPALSTRNITLTFVIGVLYSGFDEGLQMIPFIRRQAGWDDFGADVLGVLAATVLLLILSRAVRGRLAGATPVA